MKNNLNLILIILLLLAIACSCPKSETNQTSRSFTTRSSQTISPIPPASVSNTLVPLKSNSSKSASVIAENAYLRQSPNGEVLQTLPVAASIEVVRQKGPWFYVSYGTAKGWMHGNTIQYDNTDGLTATKTVPKSTPKTYNEPQTENSNPTGATAKCRDGSLSYSQNRRGTCSHHGGVAVWY